MREYPQRRGKPQHHGISILGNSLLQPISFFFCKIQANALSFPNSRCTAKHGDGDYPTAGTMAHHINTLCARFPVHPSVVFSIEYRNRSNVLSILGLGYLSRLLAQEKKWLSTPHATQMGTVPGYVKSSNNLHPPTSPVCFAFVKPFLPVTEFCWIVLRLWTGERCCGHRAVFCGHHEILANFFPPEVPLLPPDFCVIMLFWILI